VARDKSLPVSAESEFNCVAGSQIADGERVIHLISAKKKAINIVNANEAEFLPCALYKTVKPASVVRHECGSNLPSGGGDTLCCETPGD